MMSIKAMIFDYLIKTKDVFRMVTIHALTALLALATGLLDAWVIPGGFSMTMYMTLFLVTITSFVAHCYIAMGGHVVIVSDYYEYLNYRNLRKKGSELTSLFHRLEKQMISDTKECCSGLQDIHALAAQERQTVVAAQAKHVEMLKETDAETLSLLAAAVASHIIHQRRTEISAWTATKDSVPLDGFRRTRDTLQCVGVPTVAIGDAVGAANGVVVATADQLRRGAGEKECAAWTSFKDRTGFRTVRDAAMSNATRDSVGHCVGYVTSFWSK